MQELHNLLSNRLLSAGSSLDSLIGNILGLFIQVVQESNYLKA